MGGLAALILSACASNGQRSGGLAPAVSPPPDSVSGSLPSQHVHAIARDPGDGKLYLATHDGLFRYDSSGPMRVGPVIDLMGFTIAGAGHYFASGHPGPGVDLPQPVGLLESTNSGASWQQRSRAGQSDFHILTYSPAGLLAFDGVLRSSPDGGTWSDLDIPNEPRSLSASPGGERALATTAAGVLVSADHGSTWTSLSGAPLLLLTAWMDATSVVGVAPTGALHVSRDKGTTWAKARSAVTGVAQALGAGVRSGEREVLLVTDTAILRSTDDGGTLTPVVVG